MAVGDLRSHSELVGRGAQCAAIEASRGRRLAAAAQAAFAAGQVDLSAALLPATFIALALIDQLNLPATGVRDLMLARDAERRRGPALATASHHRKET
jgi:hypothetical protein